MDSNNTREKNYSQKKKQNTRAISFHKSWVVGVHDTNDSDLAH